MSARSARLSTRDVSPVQVIAAEAPAVHSPLRRTSRTAADSAPAESDQRHSPAAPELNVSARLTTSVVGHPYNIDSSIEEHPEQAGRNSGAVSAEWEASLASLVAEAKAELIEVGQHACGAIERLRVDVEEEAVQYRVMIEDAAAHLPKSNPMRATALPESISLAAHEVDQLCAQCHLVASTLSEQILRGADVADRLDHAIAQLDAAFERGETIRREQETLIQIQAEVTARLQAAGAALEPWRGLLGSSRLGQLPTATLTALDAMKQQLAREIDAAQAVYQRLPALPPNTVVGPSASLSTGV